MADAKQLDLLEILEHLDAQLDSSLESSLEIRLQRVTNAMRECTGASAAWINWVLPRHRRRTGEVGKGVTSPNISADFAAIAESTRTLGSITQPGTYRLTKAVGQQRRWPSHRANLSVFLEWDMRIRVKCRSMRPKWLTGSLLVWTQKFMRLALEKRCTNSIQSWTTAVTKMIFNLP